MMNKLMITRKSYTTPDVTVLRITAQYSLLYVSAEIEVVEWED